MKPWADIFGNLTQRSTTARPRGPTMLLDKGLGLLATADLLETAGEYIDHWKLSFGTAALLDDVLLRDKLARVRSHGILVYPGGTLGEYAMLRGVFMDFLRRVQTLGFNAIEISDGTITLEQEARHQAIRAALELGLTVVTEVGKKDPRNQPPTEALARQIHADLESGAAWVVVEARESGLGVGVYDVDGNVRVDDVDKIATALGDRTERLIWEAPLVRQQAYLIKRFGPSIGLGNIPPEQALALEALRAGLRFETLAPRAKLHSEISTKNGPPG